MKAIIQFIVSALLIAGCSNVSEKYIAYDQLDTLRLNRHQKIFVISGDSIIAMDRWRKQKDSLVTYKDSVFTIDSLLSEWKNGKIVECKNVLHQSFKDTLRNIDVYKYKVETQTRIPVELIDSVKIQTVHNYIRASLRTGINKNEITPAFVIEQFLGSGRIDIPFPTAIIRNSETGVVYGSYTALGAMVYVYGLGMIFSGINSNSSARNLFALPIIMANSELHFNVNQPGPDCSFPISGSVFVKTATDIFDSWGRYRPGAGVEINYNFLSGESKINSSIEFQFGIERLLYVQKKINPENVRLFTNIGYAF